MRLAEQWADLLAARPRGVGTGSLSLTLDDESQAERAALLLGPAAPGRSGRTFRLAFGPAGVGTSPTVMRRVLERLDREGIGGRLDAVGAEADAVGAVEPVGPGLGGQWQALVEELPVDWSHLLAAIDLDSSDFIDRAALLMAPANPLLFGPRTLHFRAARLIGYGVSAGMARRCLERLDAERITGGLRILHAVSDSRPAATQGGPVWRVGGRVA